MKVQSFSILLATMFMVESASVTRRNDAIYDDKKETNVDRTLKSNPSNFVDLISTVGDLVADFLSGNIDEESIVTDVKTLMSNIPSMSPSDIPSDAPSSVPSDMPSAMPSDTPSIVPSNAPSTSIHTERQLRSENDRILSSQSLQEWIQQILDIIRKARQVSRNSNTVTFDAPSMVPSDVPSLAPSDIPSSTPSDIPSFLPSDAPSDIPSMMPSDVPSTLPSDVPSSVPSTLPTSTPTKDPFSLYDPFNVVQDASLSEGYQVCSMAPSMSLDNQSETTILYLYRLTIKSGYTAANATKKIEQEIHSMLIDKMCINGTGFGALAISPEPEDIPTSFCTATEGASDESSCHLVALRSNMLISEKTPSEMQNLYCTAIKIIRAYIKSGELVDLVDGVTSVETLSEADIIPAFCNVIDDLVNFGDRSNISSVFDQEAVSNSQVQNSADVATGLPIALIVIACAFLAIAILYVHTGRKTSIDNDQSNDNNVSGNHQSPLSEIVQDSEDTPSISSTLSVSSKTIEVSI